MTQQKCSLKIFHRFVDFLAHLLQHFSSTFFPVVPCSDRGFHSWIAGWITYHPKHGWPRLIRQAGLFCLPPPLFRHLGMRNNRFHPHTMPNWSQSLCVA